jgi:hypothetical protein
MLSLVQGDSVKTTANNKQQGGGGRVHPGPLRLPGNSLSRDHYP